MELILQKMKSAHAETVQYWITHEGEEIHLNKLIGQEISFHFSGVIFCQECQKKINKTFIDITVRKSYSMPLKPA